MRPQNLRSLHFRRPTAASPRLRLTVAPPRLCPNAVAHATVEVGLWLAPHVFLHVLARAPWLGGIPLAGGNYTPSAALGIYLAQCCFYGAVVYLLSRGYAGSSHAVGVSHRFRLFACAFFKMWAALHLSGSISTLMVPLTNGLHQIVVPPPTDAFAKLGPTLAPSVDGTEDVLRALAVGLGGAKEELVLVAMPALLLQKRKVPWGWILAFSLFLRVGIHAKRGLDALVSAGLFGFVAFALYHAWGKVLPLFLAHFLWNYILMASSAQWSLTPEWVDFAHEYVGPIVTLAGIVLLVWLALGRSGAGTRGQRRRGGSDAEAVGR